MGLVQLDCVFVLSVGKRVVMSHRLQGFKQENLQDNGARCLVGVQLGYCSRGSSVATWYPSFPDADVDLKCDIWLQRLMDPRCRGCPSFYHVLCFKLLHVQFILAGLDGTMACFVGVWDMECMDDAHFELQDLEWDATPANGVQDWMGCKCLVGYESAITQPDQT